jgi:hypothetical protein
MEQAHLLTWHRLLYLSVLCGLLPVCMMGTNALPPVGECMGTHLRTILRDSITDICDREGHGDGVSTAIASHFNIDDHHEFALGSVLLHVAVCLDNLIEREDTINAHAIAPRRDPIDDLLQSLCTVGEDTFPFVTTRR